jgi:hypothetical protein
VAVRGLPRLAATKGADVLLVPVGHDLGVLHLSDGTRHQQVRVATDVVDLDDADYAVWLLAHGISEGFTRTTLHAAATELGLAADQVERAVDRFLADGLLVEVDPEDAVAFAQRHQLYPLVTGMGADPDQPWLQLIGAGDKPVAQLSHALYDVWFCAQLAPNLWAGCHDTAEIARRAGVDDPEQHDPRSVLTGLMRNVHALLATRGAYFDRRTAA